MAALWAARAASAGAEELREESGSGGSGGKRAPSQQRPHRRLRRRHGAAAAAASSLFLAAVMFSSQELGAAAADAQACYATCAAQSLSALLGGGNGNDSGVVCGSDGRSYATGCLAGCAGASVASAGYCQGDRMRFAGAGLPSLPSALLPFERGESEGAARSSSSSFASDQRRDPAGAMAARMGLFADEGFWYVGRTRLALNVRKPMRRQMQRHERREDGERLVVAGGGNSSSSNSSNPSAPAPSSSSSQYVEVYRATPQGDLYIARYALSAAESGGGGAAGGGGLSSLLFRPTSPQAAREALQRRRERSPTTQGESPVVAAAALAPEMVAGGGSGNTAALERQLGSLMSAPAGGNGGAPADVMAGVRWPLLDVSACLNQTDDGADGGSSNNGGVDDYVPSSPNATPTTPPPSRRRLLLGLPRRLLLTTSSSSPSSISRSLSSILGPDERERCPLSAEPRFDDALFDLALEDAKAAHAAGLLKLPSASNTTRSSGSYTRPPVPAESGSTRVKRKGMKEAAAPPSAPSPAPPPPTSPPLDPSASAGDRFGLRARWPFSALGQLETQDDAGERVCTGALVGPDLVLTAAHCVWDDQSYSFVAAPDFSPGRYRDGCRLVSPWGTVKWKHATILRAYADTWEQDVAIIKLAAPVGWRTGWLGMKASCGSVDGEAGGGGGSASSSSSSSHMSIAGYPLMPKRADDGDCFVATCGVKLVEPDAATGRCPGPVGGGGNGTASAPTTTTPAPLTSHTCDTAPGQSGAPLYDADGYARAIHVLGISTGEPDNGATTLTPWVMANLARWVGGSGGGGEGALPALPGGETMAPSAAAARASSSAAAAVVAGPVPEELKSLMDTNGTLPLDDPKAWPKTIAR